jgi:hypothetical protein
MALRRAHDQVLESEHAARAWVSCLFRIQRLSSRKVIFRNPILHFFWILKIQAIPLLVSNQIADIASVMEFYLGTNPKLNVERAQAEIA